VIRPTNFEITSVRQGRECILSITGELDMNTVASLAEQVGDAVESGSTAVTLDLRGLTFMDSSGLRMLIEVNDQSRREGWQLALTPPTEEAAAMVLQVTGADMELPFKPSGQS
jgi:anti-sigma B factor antagonist